MSSYSIDAPLFVIKNKKGDRWWVNWNNINNSHHHQYNKCKHLFSEAVQPLLKDVGSAEEVALVFTFYPPSKRRYDLTNVCGAVDKFFCDALVTAGCIPDDDYKHVPDVRYLFGEVDKDNPRMQIEIIKRK